MVSLAPMGVYALAQQWPKVLLYTFPPRRSDCTNTKMTKGVWSLSHIDCPELTEEIAANRDNAAPM